MSASFLLFLVLSQAGRENPVKLEAKSTIRLSESLLVRLSVEGGEGLQVESSPVVDSPEWHVVRQTNGEKAQLPTGRWRWHREIELEPKGVGKLTLPEITLRYREGPGM